MRRASGRRGAPAAAGGLVASLAVVVVAVGCGGGGAGTDGDDAMAPEGAPTPPTCDLITVEEVQALVGHPVTRGPEKTGATCEWTAETTSGGIGAIHASHWVELRVVDPPDVPVDGLMNSTYGDPEPLPGLGDEALLVVTGPNTLPAVQAAYRDADRMVSLTYEARLLEGDLDLHSHTDAVVELLHRVDRRASGD